MNGRINTIVVRNLVLYSLLQIIALSSSTAAFTTNSILAFKPTSSSLAKTKMAPLRTTINASDREGEGGDGKFHFAIDRGGTFTDVFCKLPNGNEIVSKLLSEDPHHYADAPTEGIRKILEQYDNEEIEKDNVHDNETATRSYARGKPVCTDKIGSIRMGTTVATNALLEREGSRMALLTTKGFQDLLEIGNQSRPNIFDLKCTRPSLLYEDVVEVDERIILQNFCSEELINDDKYPSDRRNVIGITKEKVLIHKVPNMKIVQQELETLRDKGITSIAIAFLHAYTYGQHEKLVGDMAKSMNCFDEISMSHEIMAMIKLVPRSHTCCAAAYLTPKISAYLSSFEKGFDDNLPNIPLQFMKSDGGLATPTFGKNSSDEQGKKPRGGGFGGHEAILSGPAGGVVGYAKTTYDANVQTPVIGFDMGGTSTDVSRYDGNWEHVFETVTAGVAIQAPQLDIHTVAAGGGSRLFLKRGMFVVGPESAGAHPGPVCYRKNGYLAVTDANLILGRILPSEFPHIFGPNEDQPLDLEGSRKAFEKELSVLTEAKDRTIEELAYGFLQVANEAMCRPIRNLTQMKGYDISNHILSVFGGAGPQHAVSMAKSLGMSQVFIHKHGGVLSAYGLSLADAVHEEQEPTAELYTNNQISTNGKERLKYLGGIATQSLVEQGYDKASIVVEEYLNMRYEGTDNSIMIQEKNGIPYGKAFEDTYQREFGFLLQERDILIDDYRVRAILPGKTLTAPPKQTKSLGAPPNGSLGMTRAYFENGWEDVPVYKIEELLPGHEVAGPSIIVQPIATVVLEIGCTAFVTTNGDLQIEIDQSSSNNNDGNDDNIETEIIEDPVQLSIFSHRFMGIAEQMGRTLQRTAISVNMKERLDFSCALFTKDGGLVANAPHIPVHLGAMQEAVKFQVKHWSEREGIQEGDVLLSNHPQLAGGSHLPDITVITPVFYKGEIIFYVASRGHHADVGGIAPGSMPPHSKCLEDEGAMIIAFKIVQDGQFQEERITEILQAPGKIPGNSGTRNLRDNLSDLRAQVAANNSGIRLLQELVDEHGMKIVSTYMNFIQKNAELSVRNMLKEFAAKHGTTSVAVDYMDDGSPIALSIEINSESGSALFDFTGTGPQVLGNHNAPPAVTYSATIYALRSLVGQDIPLNQGCLTPIEFKIPKNSMLNPSAEAGVVGGNVLTSQRVVDVILRAFSACAASQGCMNNLTFGDKKFGYYETIAGGSGAGPTWEGQSGVHTHCTNTRITDPEILERRYPVLLHEFSLRKGSGGKGKYSGGDGVIRELEPLRPLVMSILSERRTLQPYGMAGGEAGQCGRNLLIRENGIIVNMGGRNSGNLNVGEHLRIETPGGGGYGFVEEA